VVGAEGTFRPHLLAWWSNEGLKLARGRQLPFSIEEFRLVFISSHIQHVRNVTGTERRVDITIRKQ
jgi:hypothetical protein